MPKVIVVHCFSGISMKESAPLSAGGVDVMNAFVDPRQEYRGDIGDDLLLVLGADHGVGCGLRDVEAGPCVCKRAPDLL